MFVLTAAHSSDYCICCLMLGSADGRHTDRDSGIAGASRYLAPQYLV